MQNAKYIKNHANIFVAILNALKISSVKNVEENIYQSIPLNLFIN